MKLKRWVKILIILFILVSISITIFLVISNSSKKNKKENEDIESLKDISEVIYERLNNEINKDFLLWVNDNYSDSLLKLNELLDTREYSESLWHETTGYSWVVLNDLYNKKYENMDNVKIIDSKNPSIISIIGDVSLADNWYIMPKYDERNKKILGILSEKVVNTMNQSDLMIVNSEFTVSNRGKALSGKQYTFRAKPERLSIYGEMGVDLVTLANNHVYDCGKDAFLDPCI